MNGFDEIARDYDDDFTYSEIGKAQRNQVYTYMDLDEVVFQSRKILELNCGTGYDAAILAQRGGEVLAIDASSEMIEVANERVESLGLSDRISFKVADINNLDKELGDQKFDVVFSNFGGLNCLSPSELKTMFRSIDGHLLPGSSMIGVIMSDFCWWESVYFTLKGQFKLTWRRKKSPQLVTLNESTTIRTWYYNFRSFHDLSNGQYTLFNAGHIGFFIPPSYMESRFKKRKWLLNIFQKLDLFLIKKWKMKYGADHFYIHLKKIK